MSETKSKLLQKQKTELENKSVKKKLNELKFQADDSLVDNMLESQKLELENASKISTGIYGCVIIIVSSSMIIDTNSEYKCWGGSSPYKILIALTKNIDWL